VPKRSSITGYVLFACNVADYLSVLKFSFARTFAVPFIVTTYIPPPPHSIPSGSSTLHATFVFQAIVLYNSYNVAAGPQTDGQLLHILLPNLLLRILLLDILYCTFYRTKAQ